MNTSHKHTHIRDERERYRHTETHTHILSQHRAVAGSDGSVVVRTFFRHRCSARKQVSMTTHKKIPTGTSLRAQPTPDNSEHTPTAHKTNASTRRSDKKTPPKKPQKAQKQRTQHCAHLWAPVRSGSGAVRPPTVCHTSVDGETTRKSTQTSVERPVRGTAGGHRRTHKEISCFPQP